MPTTIPIDDEFNDEEGEWDEEHSELVYLKYLFEGCNSIGALSVRLRGLAEALDQRSSHGWELLRPVEGGYAHLAREVV
jgi:hypothetical protein